MVVAALSPADGERVAAAIGAAEARTSGEIVAVVVRESRRSPLGAMLAAALAALALPLLLWLPGLVRDASIIYAAQLALFVVLLAVLLWTRRGRRLEWPGLRRARLERQAWEQFFSLGLHRTSAGTGVMVFLVRPSTMFQVLADHGISAKVPQQAWDAIVADLVRAIREGRTADGLGRPSPPAARCSHNTSRVRPTTATS